MEKFTIKSYKILKIKKRKVKYSKNYIKNFYLIIMMYYKQLMDGLNILMKIIIYIIKI